MLRKLGSLFCLLSAMSFGQAIAATTTGPVAYVYVSSNYTGARDQIVGYAAAANGQLTKISGSPFYADVFSMAVNGKYLFGSDNSSSDNFKNIYSYLINANGSLTYKKATSIQVGSGNSCNQAGTLALDHTGADLYVFATGAYCNSEQGYQSFSVNSSTGGLNYLSMSNATEYTMFPLTVIANNRFAYAFGCNFSVSNISAYQRQSNGALQDIAVTSPLPAGHPPTGFYQECVANATADATNHLAISVNYNDGNVADQIATYTVNTANGDLSTASTYTNMPRTAVFSVLTTRMAPSGKLLAVGGTKGLQLFNFTGTSQVTARTGLLTTAEIDQVTWDNSNHLYAISHPGGKLYVFTVTATGVTQAPGSPYTITKPGRLVVEPK
jgi:hypothetical protein